MRLKLTNVPSEFDPIGRIAVVDAETGDRVSRVRKVSLIADLTTDYMPVATIEIELDLDLSAYSIVEATKVMT